MWHDPSLADDLRAVLESDEPSPLVPRWVTEAALEETIKADRLWDRLLGEGE